jgi:7,8-dihydroneopterin aldolase/epimerase/oxygenase
MSDTIFINGLVIHAHHGVMKHETKVGQRFAIDLLLTVDLKNASRSDKLADTIDYGAIVDTASRAFTARNFKLVEAAAGAVGDAVLKEYAQVTSVRVTIHKPHAPISAIFTDVGVTIERSRQGSGRG